MCQLSYIDLKDNSLNKELFLLLTAFGSTIHKDGWGMVNSDGDLWKCEFPAWATLNSGELLRKFVKNDYSPLMGHVRLASSQIPVTEENAHPFLSKNGNMLFMHNGKLTPKDESKFILGKSVETISDKGVVTTKWEKMSDSLIFFNRLQELWVNKTFYSALKDTMDEFYGKFAFMIYHKDSKVFNIIRGDSAELHISYLLESSKPEAKPIGYAVNTSKDLLDVCTTLLSNLHATRTGKELVFSTVSILDKETIYEARETDIVKVGELKENDVPKGAGFFPNARSRGSSDFWDSCDDDSYGRLSKPPTVKTKVSLLADTIWNFMTEFSLSYRDICYIIFKLYDVSMLEVDEVLIEHFVNKIIPRFRSKITKDLRRKMKREVPTGFISISKYYDESLREKGFTFPWILSSKEGIDAFFASLNSDKK